jgi:hypothetical protein
MQEPLLYLDVNFGGTKGVTRIIMYQGDTPEGVANKFCLENDIGMDKKKRLVEAISAHI